MQIDSVLKEFEDYLQSLYGDKLNSLVLYGSRARNQATEDSDIDAAAVLNGEVKPCKEIDRMIDIITDINLKHDVLLSVYPVSQQKYKNVNSPLLINLRTEGLPA